jgi:hypothetical protein
MSKQIVLTRGKFAVVDDERYEDVSRFSWRAEKAWNGMWYAARYDVNAPTKSVSLHIHIAKPPVGFIVDHKDRDGLNCQEENLRICNRSQNAANRPVQNNNKCGVKGVSYKSASRRRREKWTARIRVNQKLIHIGKFDFIEEASAAYNNAAIKYFGEFAFLNIIENMTPQQKRRVEFEKELRDLNRLVWKRDGGRCIKCGSTDINGTPFSSGAHHCLSRGAHPEIALDIRNLCLLCRKCHGDDANTEPVVREILHKMKKLPQKYDYSQPPYRGYFDD